MSMERVVLTKRKDSELEVEDLKVLKFCLGEKRMDRIRNKHIRRTAQVEPFGDKVREVRLSWFGCVQRRDSGDISRRMVKMELPGWRQRKRSNSKFMDVVREDMQVVGVTKEDIEDRARWRMI